MKKVIKDGKVAILLHQKYGAGWFTWNEKHPECLFDPEVINLILAKASFQELEKATEKYGSDFYTGALSELTVTWLPVGTEFTVHEYDGAEYLTIKSTTNWITA